MSTEFQSGHWPVLVAGALEIPPIFQNPSSPWNNGLICQEIKLIF